MKTIDTLIPDIYKLFEEGHECSEENVKAFGERLAQVVSGRLKAYKEARAPTLRMSNIGKPDRQLWYDINQPGGSEPLDPEAKFKFLYGDLLEEMVLFLAAEAGHKVEDMQKEVSVDGVLGHIDSSIDGVVVDVKSTSDYAFKKFDQGTLAQDDPFGYIKQLSGYMEAEEKDGAFLAVNKVNGKLALLRLRKPVRSHVSERIQHIRTVLDNKTPPERCYDTEDMGASGNRKLSVGCSYCPHKAKCWSDSNGGKGLRTFLYASGPVFLTTVKKEPNVYEVT